MAVEKLPSLYHALARLDERGFGRSADGKTFIRREHYNADGQHAVAGITQATVSPDPDEKCFTITYVFIPSNN